MREEYEMTPTVNGFAPVPNLGRAGWINESWLLFKQQSGVWIATTFAAGALAFVLAVALTLAVEIPAGIFSGILGGHLGSSPRIFPVWAYPAFFVVSIIQLVVYCYFGSGVLKMAIACVRREPIRVEMVFSGLPQTTSLFTYNVIFTVIYGLLTMIPQILLRSSLATSPGSIPWGMYAILVCIALVMSIVYLFIVPGEALVVDGVPVKEALSRSFASVRQNFWHVCGVSVVVFLLYILSACTCFLGLLVLLPMMALIVALSARDIAGLPVVIPEAAFVPDPSYPGAWPPPPGSWPPPPSAGIPPSEPGGFLAGPHPVPPPHEPEKRDDSE